MLKLSNKVIKGFIFCTFSKFSFVSFRFYLLYILIVIFLEFIFCMFHAFFFSFKIYLYKSILLCCHSFSSTPNFALLALGLKSISSLPGRIGFRLTSLATCFLPHTHIGKSPGQVHGFTNF